MVDFTWIGQLDAADWTSCPGGGARLTMRLGDFAQRSGCDVATVVRQFREWCFTEPRRAYSFAWCNTLDPDDLIVVARRAGDVAGGPGQRHGPA
ncbi:MAG: hypothetical protein ABWY01_09300 [Pseudoxanthomonas sp.]